MASADLLGSMCGIIPKRIGVVLVAFFFFCLGISHLMVMLVDIVYAAVGSHAVGLHRACQGSECHAEWRDELFTCNGFRGATFHVRYLTIGVLGPFFGAMGIRAVLDRNYNEMRAFVAFLGVTWLLVFGCFFTDVIYINLCHSYPTSVLRDVVGWIPREKMAQLHALGYPKLDGLSLSTIEMALEFDLMVPYSIAVVFGLLLSTYLIYCAYDLNTKMEGGPVGLGPLYLIATPADREIATISAAIKQAQAEEDTKYDFHPALGRLKDAERYPFLTTRYPQEPIGYGAVGLPQNEI